MENINKLYDEIKTVNDLQREYAKTSKDIIETQNELESLVKELNKIDLDQLHNKIVATEEEYYVCLRELDKLSAYTTECYKLQELQNAFTKIENMEILKQKSISFARSLIYPMYINTKKLCHSLNIDYSQCISENPEIKCFVVLKMSLETEEFIEFLNDYPEISQNCYKEILKNLTTEIKGILPLELKVYSDNSYLYFIFATSQVKEKEDNINFEFLSYLGIDNLKQYKNITFVLFDILKNNLKEAIIEKGLDDKALENNNECFDKTIFYVNNLEEWKMDIVMKEIIEMTRKPKDTRIEQTSLNSDKMPPHISADYLKFLNYLTLFLAVKSKRKEKAIKIVDRAIIKLFDKKRFEENVYNNFVLFADVTCFIKSNSEYKGMSELSKKRDELFLKIVDNSTFISVSLEEPLMMLKLYLKEKHFDFMENVKLFVPKINHISFEIQFFETINNNLMRKILELKNIDSGIIYNLIDLIEYIFTMMFHLPPDSISNKSKLNSYKIILESRPDQVSRLYHAKKLNLFTEEIRMLCGVVFSKSDYLDILLDEIV